MSRKKCEQFSVGFKTKLVLESLKEEKTLAQISSEHGIDPKNLSYWRAQFLDNAEIVFNQKKVVSEYKEALKNEISRTDELHRQIGELTSQLNWAKKKSKEAGLI